MHIKLTNVKINYEIIGNGRPLILIHGNQEDLHIFDCLVKTLKDTYQIYAIDSRNHGQSSKHINVSYDAMTEDLYEFINKLHINKPSILGFSDGGVIALKLAIKAPNLVDKMILCGTNYHYKGLDKKTYKAILKSYKKTFNPLVKLMLEEPKISKKTIKKIDVKTLIVVGQHDVIKSRHTQKLHHMIKKSELLILEHKTHDNYIVGKDDLASIIKKFI